ncbi:MAG: VWA domain-containing protein [Myxococcales bacterium]|nr:VWA domain-containing protein [Myxococcales bacterium]
MSRWLGLFSLMALIACGDDDRPGRDGGGGGLDGGGGDGDILRPDVGPQPDPFDPRNGCGSAAIQTEQVPGSLLLVFDDSGSMTNEVGGGTYWSVATGAINSVLESVSDELSVGLLLFPGPANACDINRTPQVAVAPLSETRTAIRSALSITPRGGVTPIINAAEAGWQHMLSLAVPGQNGVIVVTDGAENCSRTGADERAVHDAARTNNLAYGVKTFAVGLTTSNSLLSGLAYYGGTPRTSTCMPECSPNGRECTTNADCEGGARCESALPFPVPGFPDLRVCQGGAEAECCHYNVSSAGFASEFETALREIAQRFLDSCVFRLPRGTDPSMFDAGQVNVGVTFDGEDRTVLRRSSDPDSNSWNYTSDEYESIVIQGPICERLLDENAVVEIVLGCPTLLI